VSRWLKNIAPVAAGDSDAFTISMATHLLILHIGFVHVGSATNLMREYDEL